MNNGEHKELTKGSLEKIIEGYYATHATNKKNIIKWLECSSSKMPCMLLRKKQLQESHKENLTQRSHPN